MTMPIVTRKGSAWISPDRSVTDWLGLAASPTFGLMGWFAASDAVRMPICSLASGPLPIHGMAGMYLLMCLFHISPWLKLLSGRLRPVDQPACHPKGD